ncbi:MAG: hypothetical protein IT211_02905 [Armatimonadetes bacterium]|nr:hypothetical protein [Armatimonadota bacterium]
MNKHIFLNLLTPIGAALAIGLGGCVTLATHHHYTENPNATAATNTPVTAQTASYSANNYNCCNHQQNPSYSSGGTQDCQHGYYSGGYHPTPPIYRNEHDYRYYDYSNNDPWQYGRHKPYVIYVPTTPQPNRNGESAQRTDAEEGSNGGAQPQDGVQSQPRRAPGEIYRAERPAVLPTVNDERRSEPRRTIPAMEEQTHRAERPAVLPTVNDERRSEPRRTIPAMEEQPQRAERPAVLPTVNDERRSEPRRTIPAMEEQPQRAERPAVLPTVNDERKSEPRRTIPVVDAPPQQTSQPPVVPVMTGPASEPRRFQQRRFEQSEVPARAQQPAVRPEATPAAIEESKPRRVVVAPVVPNESAAPAKVVGETPVESTVRAEQWNVDRDAVRVQSQKSERVVVVESKSATGATPSLPAQSMPAEQGGSSTVRRAIPMPR